MEKLRRALRGDDAQAEEESGIMPQVHFIYSLIDKYLELKL